MFQKRNTWVVILAAGSGQRLRSLTAGSDGKPVPKQYCSLFGGKTLIEETIARARNLASAMRVCAIVDAGHAQWWKYLERLIPTSNLIVQPEDRGTGNGVLLTMLHILSRDARAQILFLPSDHHVDNPHTLHGDVLDMLQATQVTGRLCLLGFHPDHADPHLGYIVPGDEDSCVRSVDAFVEKPDMRVSEALIDGGALWNSFIFAAPAPALLDLFRLRALRALALQCLAKHSREASALRAAYSVLPKLDFSKDILSGSESSLRVVTGRACGWTDLGTPDRLGMFLRRTDAGSAAPGGSLADIACRQPTLAEAYFNYASSAQSPRAAAQTAA